MLFVNDIAGVSGTPAWMKHISPADADGMTFVDVVFPAFLFIVGMSIPFAIDWRLASGEGYPALLGHIGIRTASLLIIGVYMVNSGSASASGVLSPPLWTLLMYCGVMLVWNVWPARKPARTGALRLAGALLLVAMAVLYRGPGDPGFIELRPQWWGILGLIGWAYLIAALTYLALRRTPAGVVGVMALLYCLYMADSAGALAAASPYLPWINIGSMWGSHAALTISGVILGMMLKRESRGHGHASRMREALCYGAALAVTGLLLHSLHGIHRMFIINKIFATPPWCLLCAAITVACWIAIYWVVDVQEWKRWTAAVRPAGRNALFAYILAPIFYALFALSAAAFGGFNFYNALGSGFPVGLLRSIVFAFAMTWLAGWLSQWGVRLKL